MKSRSKSSTKKSKSPKKVDLDKSKHDSIKEKQYVTKEIETSITLLDSPEDAVVLEALLFLSKYADIQENNLNFIQAHGMMPKLFALLERNICLMRLSLRLLAQALTTKNGLQDMQKEEFDAHILKVCKLFTQHDDEKVQAVSLDVLVQYAKNYNKLPVLASDSAVIKTVLKRIATSEDQLLTSLLELFFKLIELPDVLNELPQEGSFNIDQFISLLYKFPSNFPLVYLGMEILQKLTYLAENPALFEHFKNHKLVEYMLDILTDPERENLVLKALFVVKNCMVSSITNSYFVETLEFLKFCKWSKTCSDEALPFCADIFVRLTQMDAIRQMMFDLSVEDSVLSLLRSDNRDVLNKTFEAISNMTVHKYCCEKIVTPVVVKKVLDFLRECGDNDPDSETALQTLHNFCKRDARTKYMIRTCQGVDVLLTYLKKDTEMFPKNSYKKILDIVAMFISNAHLKSALMSNDLYKTLIKHVNSVDEISAKAFEILHYCLDEEEFREYFVSNNGPSLVITKIGNTKDERLLRHAIGFVHSCLMYDPVSESLIHGKLLLVLKTLPQTILSRIPLIDRTINLIYNICLPIKFHETGRLEFSDKLTKRFYVLTGIWDGHFPFLEVLQLQMVSTLRTIYVVDFYESDALSALCKSCVEGSSLTLSSFTSSILNYGGLSRDRYLPKYVSQLQKLLTGVMALPERVKILAEFVDACLCGPKKDNSISDKTHNFKFHLESIKFKLGTNMIPIGYLRLGFYRERALLFKALADQSFVPATLVRGKDGLFWNEVAVVHSQEHGEYLKLHVVDLMDEIGRMLPIGSRDCNVYCNIK